MCFQRGLRRPSRPLTHIRGVHTCLCSKTRSSAHSTHRLVCQLDRLFQVPGLFFQFPLCLRKLLVRSSQILIDFVLELLGVFQRGNSLSVFIIRRCKFAGGFLQLLLRLRQQLDRFLVFLSGVQGGLRSPGSVLSRQLRPHRPHRSRTGGSTRSFDPLRHGADRRLMGGQNLAVFLQHLLMKR